MCCFEIKPLLPLLQHIGSCMTISLCESQLWTDNLLDCLPSSARMKPLVSIMHVLFCWWAFKEKIFKARSFFGPFLQPHHSSARQTYPLKALQRTTKVLLTILAVTLYVVDP